MKKQIVWLNFVDLCSISNKEISSFAFFIIENKTQI